MGPVPPGPSRSEVAMAATGFAEGPDRRWSKVARYGRRARVTRTGQVARTGTQRIRFQVVDDGEFSFLAGQFVGIEFLAPGLGYRRSPYCLLPPPPEERSFELLVRTVENGQMSRYLGSLQVGDEVAFRAPTGRSMLPKDPDRELILLATGVGIAPFVALAAHLTHEGYRRPIRLFWGLRRPDDICLRAELDELLRVNRNFAYEVSLSEPPAAWDGLRGRITESVPPLLPQLGGRAFYLCGNGAMVEEMDMALSDMGVSAEFIYKEAYFNRSHRPDPATMERLRARFVADDLFSPFAHQSASLFEVHKTFQPVGRNVTADASSDLFRRVPRGRHATRDGDDHSPGSG
ncbi:MAG TPA: FAD-dependent oxidoreductase [Acidimicrobiales bacterium]|nr:FAD-dependent oxidoreductase [Acidimicrobiales bacterium]